MAIAVFVVTLPAFAQGAAPGEVEDIKESLGDILFVVRQQYKADHHNTATLFQMGEINANKFVGGGAMKILDSATGKTKTLLESATGVIRDPELSFDAQRIVFSMRKNIDDDYHIYEINIDGNGLKQLTFVKGVSDIDPLFLPSGDIVFSSTREPKFCMCNRHIMANLFRMESDGANIHQIGKSTLFEGHGTILPSGQILYDRWEYVDRNFGDAQGLWTVNPDGTNHAIYWGNNTYSPGGVIDARLIPGTDNVVCTFTSCHDRPWGAIAIIDRSKGLDGPDAVVKIWPADAKKYMEDTGRYGIDNFTAVNPKYEDPYPLSDTHFLVSRMTGDDEQMGIYLLDIFGNEQLIHTEGDGCFDPMPVKARPKAPAIPQKRDFENASGSLYVTNVYEGTHMKGVEPGSVKYLRVVESPEKRFWVPRARWGGQGQQNPAMAWHDFNNKRILGTVEVEADGSVYFELPSDTFVYFQLLDKNGMMIQSMRSGTIVQSGETMGCIGCHEDRLTAPKQLRHPTLAALKKPAQKLNGWYGPARAFDYIKEVQPVFDKSCVGCHDYDKPEAETLILAGDRTNTFNASYNELWRKKYIASIGAGRYEIQQAYSWGSHKSRLVKKLIEGCNGVKPDKEGFDRVVTWIDINAPYYSRYDSAYPHNLSGRSPLNDQQIARLTELTGVEFTALASHHRNQGPQVSFDRPELSPCLAVFEDKIEPAYIEALAIIQQGAELLKQKPRADMDGFVAWETDQQRQKKYLDRQRIENENRHAIKVGKKVYDKP